MAALWMKKLAKGTLPMAYVAPDQGTELGMKRESWITASLGHMAYYS